MPARLNRASVAHTARAFRILATTRHFEASACCMSDAGLGDRRELRAFAQMHGSHHERSYQLLIYKHRSQQNIKPIARIMLALRDYGGG